MTSKQILEDVNLYIKKLDTDMDLLNEKCIEYVREYDAYSQSMLYDGSLLKEKMKTTIIQAVPNDI